MCSRRSIHITQLVEQSKSIMDKWEQNTMTNQYSDKENNNDFKIQNKLYPLHENKEKFASQSPLDISEEYGSLDNENGEAKESPGNKCESLTGDDVGEMENESDEYEEYDSENDVYDYEYQDEHGNIIEIKEIEDPKFITVDWHVQSTIQKVLETKEIQMSESEDEDKSDIFGPEDVTFTVGYQNKKIKAHHKVLCRESPVFRKLIYEDNLRELKVPDADPGDFEAFLKCLYTKRQKDLSMIADIEDAFEISYLATKYQITRLVDKSKTALRQLIETENAATILEKATTYYKNSELGEVAFEFICKNTSEVFESKSFTQLSHSNLCRLLEQDTLTIEELPLFKAVYRWAVSFLNRKVIDGNADILRNALAEPLHLIRFNLMSLEDFVTYVCKTSVLTAEKERGISQYLSLPTCERNVEELSAYLFKTNPRYALYIPKDCYVVQRIPRCKSEELGDDSDLYSKNAWGFSFQANRPISLVSLGMYGPKNQPRMNCQVKIEVIEPAGEEKSKIISETEIEQNFRLNDNIFHVTLTKPVKIMPDKLYIVRFQILKGPMTAICSGALKVAETICKNGDKIVLQFGDYCKGFLTTTNQLPELMFSLAH